MQRHGLPWFQGRAKRPRLTPLPPRSVLCKSRGEPLCGMKIHVCPAQRVRFGTNLCFWRDFTLSRWSAAILLMSTWALPLAAAPSPSLTAPPKADAARIQDAVPPIGIFNDHGDVGTVLHPGAGTFDAATASYAVVGSGENMWFAKDAFHYVWKKASGDLSLTADISFIGPGTEPH